MMKLKKPNYKLPRPTIYKPKPLWTGKQVFDLIMPKINLVRYNSQNTSNDTKYFSCNDSQIIIKNGKYIFSDEDRNNLVMFLKTL